MPYIVKSARDDLLDRTVWEVGECIDTPGQLNFVLSYIAWQFLSQGGNIDPHYDEMNVVLGAFEAAKLEFYRRVMAPYEDKKCEENGDVYVNDDD